MPQYQSVYRISQSYGELVQYGLSTVETASRAQRVIYSRGFENNRLQILDLSYNHLGPDLAECVPSAVMKHPALISQSGDDFGPKREALSLRRKRPGGFKDATKKEALTREVDRRRLRKKSRWS